MTTDTVTESVLEEKFRSSYAQLARERRYSLIGGNFEAIALVMLIGLVLAVLHYAFWGAGFSKFSAAQHNASVLMLQNLEGPHLPMLEADLAAKGYISLVEYKDYTQMAQKAKAERLKSKRAALGGSTIIDKTTRVDRPVYASEEEALRQLQVGEQLQEQAIAAEGGIDAPATNDAAVAGEADAVSL